MIQGRDFQRPSKIKSAEAHVERSPHQDEGVHQLRNERKEIAVAVCRDVTCEVHRNAVDQVCNVPAVAAFGETAQSDTKTNATLVEIVRRYAGDITDQICVIAEVALLLLRIPQHRD